MPDTLLPHRGNMDSRFKVSIIVISYKQRDDWLNECLRSVCAQTYAHREIIFSGVRGDSNLDIAKMYPVTIVDTHPQGYGNRLAKTQINNGIRHATGEYVIVFGSDDYIYPSAVEDMMRVAEEKDSVIVYSDLHYADEKMNIIFKHKAPEFSWDRLKQTQIMNDCSLVKRVVLQEFGLFDPEWKKFAVWDMWFKIAAKYRDIHHTGRVMMKYRRHDNSMGIMAFRGDGDRTGEDLRPKFCEAHGIKRMARIEYLGNKILTVFSEDVNIMVDNEIKRVEIG